MQAGTRLPTVWRRKQGLREEVVSLHTANCRWRRWNKTPACLFQIPMCAARRSLPSHFLGVPNLALNEAWSLDYAH